MNRLTSALFLLSGALFSLASASGAPIAILNSDFETNAATLVPNDGDFTVNNVPEWDDHFPLGGSGIFNPDTFAAVSGIAVLYLDSGGYVVQDLEQVGGAPVNAEPFSTISISGQINNRFSNPSLQLQVSLRVLPNNNILPSVFIDPVDVSGWNPFTATFNLPDAATLGAAANQPLFLVFDGRQGQVNVDDVTGTFDPVPEPSAAVMLLTGAAAISLRRRTRRAAVPLAG